MCVKLRCHSSLSTLYGIPRSLSWPQGAVCCWLYRGTMVSWHLTPYLAGRYIAKIPDYLSEHSNKWANFFVPSRKRNWFCVLFGGCFWKRKSSKFSIWKPEDSEDPIGGKVIGGICTIFQMLEWQQQLFTLDSEWGCKFQNTTPPTVLIQFQPNLVADILVIAEHRPLHFLAIQQH